MELNQEKKNNLTKPRSLNDPKEKERILMQYSGVFKKNIAEFGKTISRTKPQKNYSE